MIKKGLIHCTGVLLLTLAVFLIAYRLFALSKPDSEALAGIGYMLTVGFLGYIWKLKNGRTFSVLDPGTNKTLIHYAFGAAIVLVCVTLPLAIKIIVSVGSWWPLALLFLIPFGLFSQAVNFIILMVVGGWFCRK